MSFPIAISIIGFCAIALEFFLPGGIFALIGGLFVIAGVSLFAISEASLQSKCFFAIGSIATVALICRALLFFFRSRKDNALRHEASLEDATPFALDPKLYGLEGVADSDLRPSGFILVEGQRHQAVSEGRYITKGIKVKITKGRGAHYIVKEKL